MEISVPTWTTRLAVAADAEQLSRFKCRNPNERWTRDVQQFIRRVVAQSVRVADPDVCVHVAIEADGTIVSLGAHGPVDSPEQPTSHYVSVLATTHEWRRRGIAIALKREMMRECQTIGVEAALSDVHKDNTPMNELNKQLRATTEPSPVEYEMLFTVTKIPKQ